MRIPTNCNIAQVEPGLPLASMWTLPLPGGIDWYQQERHRFASAQSWHTTIQNPARESSNVFLSLHESDAAGAQQDWNSMKTTMLGRTGLRVSRIAFGTWQLGGEWGPFDEDVAVAAIRHARELGVNFFDMAQAYGFGPSERILGKALRDELTRDRDALVIATKGGLRQTDSGLVRDAPSPPQLQRRRPAGNRPTIAAT